MDHARHSSKPAGTSLFAFKKLLPLAAITWLMLVAASPCVGQKKPTPPAARSGQTATKPATKSATAPAKSGDWTKRLDQYPGLMDDFARLLGRWQTEVQFPGARTQSRLLSLLPENTAFYGGFPNYGEAAHQALLIFHQELEHSSALRNWWQKEAGQDGRKFEDSVEKFYRLSQFLGDEIVVSSPMSDKENRVLILAELKKPGVQAVLQQLTSDLKDKPGSPMRILTPEQLAAAKDDHPSDEPVALVRNNLLAVAFDLSVLRSLNAKLDQGPGKSAADPFVQRLGRAYEGGIKTLFAADLQRVLSKVPTGNTKDQAAFRVSGFADMKYFVAESRDEAPGQAANQAELSFIGPRHGAASWLASARPLSGLDFASPKAIMAIEILLKNPALIFDDIADLVNTTQPDGLASVTQMEHALNISLRNDILGKLTGEIALDAESPEGPQPKIKIMLGTNDATGLQRNLERLLAALNIKPKPYTDAGLTSYAIRVPNPSQPIEVHYAFAAGYLMIGMDPSVLTEALSRQRSGDSLGRSNAFRASLPGGTFADTSALFYQNLGPLLGPVLQQSSPEVAQLIQRFNFAGGPVAMRLTGDETTIKVSGGSGAGDITAVMIVAAIAIPNLLRSRISANESAAISTVRTINTAQVTYMTIYPARGFAPSLAMLGPGPKADCRSGKVTEENACLLDSQVGGAGCTSGAWCDKGAYRYSVAGICKKQRCDDFVVVATPSDAGKGSRNFCSTSDGITHSKSGPPLTAIITAAECNGWPVVR